MFLTQFICHSKGKVHHVSVSTKRNIYRLDQALLKKLNLENIIYTQKMVSKVKLTKQDGSFKDNEIFQNYTTGSAITKPTSFDKSIRLAEPAFLSKSGWFRDAPHDNNI